MDFRYLPPAEEEMIEAALFYEKQARRLGIEFLDDVQRAVDRLRDNPKSGEVVVNELRRGLLSRFPFFLIYAVEAEAVLIVAVAHQRRRPYYWKGRTDR